MTVKIVLPESTGGVRTTTGTRVFTSSGEEIENITHISIDLGVDCIVEATITVAVSDIENLTDIKSHFVTQNKPSIFRRVKRALFK